MRLSPFDDQRTTNKPAELHLHLGSAAQIGHMIIHYYKNNKISRTAELYHGDLILGYSDIAEVTKNHSLL